MSRRWVRRLLVGAAAAMVVAVGVPSGGAIAAQPSLTSAAVAAAPLQLQPRGVPATSKSSPSPMSDTAARSRTAERLQARARADEQQWARARAVAAKRATQLAQAAQRARSVWEARGQPTTMAILRPDTVDLVADGRLTRRVPRRQGDLTLVR